jgi:hypothetical protein
MLFGRWAKPGDFDDGQKVQDLAQQHRTHYDEDFV